MTKENTKSDMRCEDLPLFGGETIDEAMAREVTDILSRRRKMQELDDELDGDITLSPEALVFYVDQYERGLTFRRKGGENNRLDSLFTELQVAFFSKGLKDETR